MSIKYRIHIQQFSSYARFPTRSRFYFKWECNHIRKEVKVNPQKVWIILNSSQKNNVTVKRDFIWSLNCLSVSGKFKKAPIERSERYRNAYISIVIRAARPGNFRPGEKFNFEPGTRPEFKIQPRNLSGPEKLNNTEIKTILNIN